MLSLWCSVSLSWLETRVKMIMPIFGRLIRRFLKGRESSKHDCISLFCEIVNL